MKYTSRIYLSLVFAILYIPILTLILFSFNAGESTALFEGFSLNWYIKLFKSDEAFNALKNTLILAVLSALIATVIGTAAAEGIYRMKKKAVKTAVNSVTNIPMMNPDIVTGMSLMLFFAAALGILKLVFVNLEYNDIGFAAMLISHITFCLPYVILSVLPRITELGNTLSEAALDLGCTPFKAFFKAKLPNIMPAVLSGMVMAFTLSLDDFVISYFVAPSNFQTLPLLIYSMTKKRVKPDMYALSTLIIVAIFILLIISNLKSDKKSKKFDKKKKIATVSVIAAVLVLALVLAIVSAVRGTDEDSVESEGEEVVTPVSGDTVVLNVFNWGEYISKDDPDVLDVIEEFEKYCLSKGMKVKVNYSTYATNEDLYSKIKYGAVSYDIVIPSDYMIQKMINDPDGSLLYSYNIAEEIPNYKYIADEFKNPYYDPLNTYSVPYTYGMMGIIYNKAYVKDKDYTLSENQSWELMWNENYRGKIVQYNNPRDGFATAMYLLALDINSTDSAVWNRALQKLQEQKPLLQAYVNDEIFDKMTGESAYIGSYYVGDYITMAESQPNLAFYYPKEGVNYFVDAMCILESSKQKELAKEFINFMLTEEVAIANAEYIGYASPNTLVSSNEEYREALGEENYALLYATKPEDINASYIELISEFNPNATACYENFSSEMQEYVNDLWEELKITSSVEVWVHVLTFIIVASVLTLAVYTTYTKKKHSRHYRIRDKIAKENK